MGLFFQTCNGLGITFKSLIFFLQKNMFFGPLGGLFLKNPKKSITFPIITFLGLFFQTSDGLGITFKDLILFFKKKKKSFLAHRGSFLKNQKNDLKSLVS